MRYLVLCLCWLSVTSAQAKTLALAWDYDGPAPERFMLSLVDHTGAVVSLSVQPSSPEACKLFPEAGPQTFCALWPDCPPAGVWVFFVMAQSQGAESPVSAPLTCQVVKESPCACAASVIQTTPAPASTQPLAIPSIPQEVKDLLIQVPQTAPGKALAGPELLKDALNVTAPPVPMPGGT